MWWMFLVRKRKIEKNGVIKVIDLKTTIIKAGQIHYQRRSIRTMMRSFLKTIF